MAISPKDKTILRDLAKQLAEIASLPIQQEKKDLWCRLNQLERVRPMILLQNETWHETGHQIKMETCGDNFVRQQEWNLRTLIYHYEHMKDDHVYEPKIYSPIIINCTSIGIETNATIPDHIFGAKHYHCIIPNDAEPDKMILLPLVTVDWEETERIYQQYNDIYDGILTVEKQGVNRLGFAIMDDFIQWRGIENTFTDMKDRPQWIHAWLDKLTKWHLSILDEYEKLNVLSLNNGNVGIGPGGLGFTDELPQLDFDGIHLRPRDMWGHATTQIFSLVSPLMHEEFALQYEKQFLSRFGLASYGCCEPLDMKVDMIEKNIPNLRRLSMSPWADVTRGAKAIGKKFIFSYKPNPAILGMEKWDRELAQRQLQAVFEKRGHCI